MNNSNAPNSAKKSRFTTNRKQILKCRWDHARLGISIFNTSLWSFPWCPLIIWFNLLKCLQLLIWSNLFQKNSHASENYYIHPTPLWGLVFKNLCSKVVHQSIDCNSQIGHNSVKMKYFEISFFFFFGRIGMVLLLLIL